MQDVILRDDHETIITMEEKYKMDFGLSKKHEMARSLFKEFAENEVKPLAQEVDETEKLL